MAVKVLISMRDMAASAHLLEVIKVCKKDQRFDLAIIAQNPASHFLTDMSIAHECADLPPATYMSTPEAKNLLSKAAEIIKKNKPQVILTGLSTPLDGGIDEAILKQAKDKIPTFMFQDFWGEQNKFFGTGADCAFVLDSIAEQRNRHRFNLRSIISGSPRHAAYRNIDWAAERKQLRYKLEIADNEHVIGYFGQALNHLPGYWRTVSAFIQTIGQMKGNISVAVRHHPRENAAARARTVKYFKNIGVRQIPVEDGPIENSLPIYDVVCSLFSNCTFDASYQNWFSSEPLSVPVSMLFDPEIADYCRERIHFEDLPIHTHKLVIPVYEKENLQKVLQKSILYDSRKEAWQQAKNKLDDPGQACQIILDQLYKTALEHKAN